MIASQLSNERDRCECSNSLIVFMERNAVVPRWALQKIGGASVPETTDAALTHFRQNLAGLRRASSRSDFGKRYAYLLGYCEASMIVGVIDRHQWQAFLNDIDDHSRARSGAIAPTIVMPGWSAKDYL